MAATEDGPLPIVDVHELSITWTVSSLAIEGKKKEKFTRSAHFFPASFLNKLLLLSVIEVYALVFK